MTDPQIRKRTPAEILTHVAEQLRGQPDATTILGLSITLEMLAEELAAASPAGGADEVLDRLNRALAELGMPAAAFTLTSGVSTYDMRIGLPVAVLRLVHAEDPGRSYGVVRIQFPFEEGSDA